MSEKSGRDDLGMLPHAIGVNTVNTDDLRPNPHNPRMLFDRQPLDTLKKSIEKVGILVPLTVYKAKGSDKYTILDGQRRWICAQEAGLSKIPINEVAEPTVAQNIVTMFQIHKLRKDWELMPTALKLDVLMNELKEKGDRQLAELTGLDVAVVVRCKKLLSYTKNYQNMMLFAEPADRVKADFFIELYPIVTDRSVKNAEWFDKTYFIDRMLKKYQSKKSEIKSITDFRTIKQHIMAATKAGHSVRLLRRLREFLEDDNLPVQHLEISSATIKKRANAMSRSVEKIIDQISEIEAMEFYGEEDFWKSLEKLVDVVSKKLREADRRRQ